MIIIKIKDRLAYLYRIVVNQFFYLFTGPHNFFMEKCRFSCFIGSLTHDDNEEDIGIGGICEDEEPQYVYVDELNQTFPITTAIG